MSMEGMKLLEENIDFMIFSYLCKCVYCLLKLHLVLQQLKFSTTWILHAPNA